MSNIYFVFCFISFFLLLIYILLNQKELFQEIDYLKSNAILFYDITDFGDNIREGDIYTQVKSTGEGKNVKIKILKVFSNSVANTSLVSGGYNHKKNDLVTLQDKSGTKEIILKILGITGIKMKIIQEEEESEESEDKLLSEIEEESLIKQEEEEESLLQQEEEESLLHQEEEESLLHQEEEESILQQEELISEELLEEAEEEIGEETDYTPVEESRQIYYPLSKRKTIEEIYFKLDKENINSLNKYQTRFYDNTEKNLNSSSVRKYTVNEDPSVISKYSKVYRNIEIPSINIVKILDKIKDKYKY